ncbi:hypothetical protein A2874_03795 [Candidatus Daviesbacteria bacterium RIFCSPHIGHO2_01_FULL_43_17]|nr:MAG: hypothetical protein A2874_03795 [Candidatus Daviesbacteria bacterium RIFCSPHIGHO2_01_FULL_43_17]
MVVVEVEGGGEDSVEVEVEGGGEDSVVVVVEVEGVGSVEVDVEVEDDPPEELPDPLSDIHHPPLSDIQ